MIGGGQHSGGWQWVMVGVFIVSGRCLLVVGGSYWWWVAVTGGGW